MSDSETKSRSKRRTFLQGSALLATGINAFAGAAGVWKSTGITDVAGVRVGHFTDKRRPTGCTVILFDGAGAVGGVDVRGSAPGTRETDLLNPLNTVQKVNAIVLSGGSAFGLDTATGVMRFLEAQGAGFRVGSLAVPIVPAAILFDLGLGDPKIRPDAEAGFEACRAASNGLVAEGCVGVGAGATVGKLFGLKRAMKSGVGTASVRVGDTDLVVAALLAVNAVGDVFDPHNGTIVAGARTADGKGFMNAMTRIMSGYGVRVQAGTNTTLGVVATNATFTKTQATKIAQMAHDGIARTIRPAHTSFDGDTIFAACTGASSEKVEASMIGAIAAEVVAEAVIRAVKSATGLPGLPSFRDLQNN